MEIMLQLGLKEKISTPASQECKWVLSDMGVTREATEGSSVKLALLSSLSCSVEMRHA